MKKQYQFYLSVIIVLFLTSTADRPSGFRVEMAPQQMQNLYLRLSGTNYFLSNTTPTGAVKYKDSSSVNYSNGNPWKEIGVWGLVLQ